MLLLRASIRGPNSLASPFSHLSQHTALQLSNGLRHRLILTLQSQSPTRLLYQDNRRRLGLPPSTSSKLSRMTLTQRRGHGSHSHSHQHDNTYLTSMNKKDAGVRITRIGLLVNLAMAIGKGVGGSVFHSQALIADAFHALTDLVSDFMTLATVSWSLKTPTQRFPCGYGKIESLGALGVSSLLLFGGIGMGANALGLLYTQAFLDGLQENHHHGLFSILGHDHSHAAKLPNLNAAWLAGGSIVVKEWLYRSTMKIARERKSAVLASNAVHHRIDSLTSIVALVTIGGAHLFADASWLDAVGGLIISVMVIRAGWANTMTALLELADVSVDDEIRHAVHRATTKALNGGSSNGIGGVIDGNLVTVGPIQGVKSGQNYLIDIQLTTPRDWTLEKIQTVEDAVRERVGSKVRGVKKVRVRFVPEEKGEQSFSDEFISASVSPESSPEPDDEHVNVDRDGHRQGIQIPQVPASGGRKMK